MRKLLASAIVSGLFSLICAIAAAATPAASAAPTWIAGQHYFLARQPQATNAPAGKVEVLEVFSYACPACNHFGPLMRRLKASLPATAQFGYLPASWHRNEDWPVFQRAFFAAQSLGLVERTHDAIFDAIWKTGELAIFDEGLRRPKQVLPAIADVAQWYVRKTGVTRLAFLTAAQSFGVEMSMRRADSVIRALPVDQTPTVVVNGKYRVTLQSAGGEEPLINVVKWLVDQESAHR